MSDKKKTTLELSTEEHRQLRMQAASLGISIKDLILQALDKSFPSWRTENKK